MINTLSIARKLSAAGIERKHAEAQAEVIAEAVERQRDEVATKDFVRSEISPVRADVTALKSDVAALKWIAGVHMAITLVLFAVVLAG